MGFSKGIRLPGTQAADMGPSGWSSPFFCHCAECTPTGAHCPILTRALGPEMEALSQQKPGRPCTGVPGARDFGTDWRDEKNSALPGPRSTVPPPQPKEPKDPKENPMFAHVVHVARNFNRRHGDNCSSSPSCSACARKPRATSRPAPVSLVPCTLCVHDETITWCVAPCPKLLDSHVHDIHRTLSGLHLPILMVFNNDCTCIRSTLAPQGPMFCPGWTVIVSIF